MESRLRNALVALSPNPYWQVYQVCVKEMLDDWQAQINNPETDLALTAVLRYARIRVLEIAELPEDALEAQEEEKDERPD